MKKLFFYLLIIFGFNISTSQELIIGEEIVTPGIVFIFEGAVKDHVMPAGMHLKESISGVTV